MPYSKASCLSKTAAHDLLYILCELFSEKPAFPKPQSSLNPTQSHPIQSNPNELKLLLPERVVGLGKFGDLQVAHLEVAHVVHGDLELHRHGTDLHERSETRAEGR